jgi:hypothetical protein
MMLGFGQLGDTTAGVTAQSLGIPAPDCAGGSAFVDDNGEWQCTAPPPVASSSGGAGVFLVAAALAIAAYWYFGNKAAKTYRSFSSGDPKQIFGSLT